MTFAGMNYWAVLAAAVAAWVLGAVWYSVLSAPWISAQGWTKQDLDARMKATRGTPAFYAPFVLSFVAELVMAWVLAGTMAHVGAISVRNGIISALFVWFGFVLTTISVNYAYAGKRPMLTVIDAGHWLAVLLVMGIVIGTWGL